MDDHTDPWHDESSEELEAFIKPELNPGERLLWASRVVRPSGKDGPRPFASGLTWTVGLGLVSVACLVLLPPAVVLRMEAADALLLLVGIVAGIFSFFVALGTIAGVVSRRAARRASANRVYALTDRRAILWDPVAKSTAVTVHTLTRGTLKREHVRRVQYPDGSGDVLLRGKYEHPAGFLGVAEVRRVEELVRRYLIDPVADVDSRIEPSPVTKGIL